MKHILFLLLAFCIQLGATEVTNLQNPSSCVMYGKFEIQFQVDASYDNPYDPDEVLIDGLFESPGGTVFRVPAFRYQDCARSLNGSNEEITLIGDPEWRIRYAPIQIGTHQFQIEITDASGTTISDPVTFDVVSSTIKGYIHVDPDDSQYMAFDDGSFYFPVGQNVGWGHWGGTYDYDIWMAHMADANHNWIRIWSTHFYDGQLLEWNETNHTGWYHGLGRYSQQGAWKWDYYIELAEQLGIYIQLVTQHHGQFSQSTNPNWDECPYNVDNGGMLESGDEFFDNEEAKDLYKRKMRYSIARWGYSTAILAWELFNEVQWTDDYDANYPTVAAWHEEMAAYVHSIDPWQHLVTTSARDEDALIWGSPDMDINQIHYYGADVSGALRHRYKMMQQYGKPCIMGEFGDSWQTGGTDESGTFIHDGIWGTSMMGTGAMPWWWDNYTEVYDLYYHWVGLAAFWEGEDFRNQGFESIHVETSGGPSSEMGVRWTPGKSWENSTEHEFWVTSDWEAPGIENLSKYIHGSDKADMGSEAIFHFSIPNVIVFGVHVSEVSTWVPGIVQIFLDEADTPVVNETAEQGTRYDVDVPAGDHTVRVYNAGTDWFHVDYFEVEGATRPAARAVGFSNEQTCFVWVRDMDYRLGESPHDVLSNVEITVPDLESSTYSVEQWHTTDGSVTEAQSVSVSGDLILTLADFGMDAALKIKKTTGVPERDPDTVPTEFGLLPNFPNPFNGQTILRYMLPEAGPVKITLYDLKGREIRTLLDKEKQAGVYRQPIRMNNLPSGTYVIKLISESQESVRKVMLLK
ncbi:DUF5060 domain-containing protein [candidate division KSB1 bacterium]|nr:DUF5060 domain-containing protein [candidate division KSB1 bacterium]